MQYANQAAGHTAGRIAESPSFIAVVLAKLGRFGRSVFDAIVESNQRRAERYVRDYHRYL